jgi:DHA3 family macrolide efflux protein-like MFS transporter
MEAVNKGTDSGFGTFLAVWGGQFISLLGSQVTAFALGIWVFKENGAVTPVALIILSLTLPEILVSPFAGALTDRWDRKRVMMFSDVTSALATSLAALLVYIGHLPVWMICVLAGIKSIASSFQSPAFMSSIALLIPKRHFGRASGLAQLSQAVPRILAPLIAGVLIGFIGLTGILIVDVGTFIFAIVVLLSVRIPSPPPSAAGQAGKGSILKEAAAGWQFLRERRGLLGFLVIFMLMNFLIAFTNVLTLPLTLSFASELVVGTIVSIGGVGMVIGSVLVIIRGGPKRRVLSLMGFMFLGGIAIALVGMTTSTVLLGFIYFSVMACVPNVGAANQVLWQTKVEADIQGRVFALRRMLVLSSTPAAYLLAGPLADHVFEPLLLPGGALANSAGQILGVGRGRGIGLMFVLMGLGTAVVALVGYLNPRIRHLETDLPDVIEHEPSLSVPGSPATATAEAQQG